MDWFDEEAGSNFFNQISKIWIKPEINRRRLLGLIDENFTWSSCRILLPRVGPNQIEFNKEIRWLAIIKKAPNTTFEYGQSVYLHELQKVIDVLRPKLNDKPTGFIYVEFFEGNMEITFDLSPTHDNFKPEDDRLGYTGRNIVNSIQREIDLKVIHYYQILSKSLREVGLWASPSLIPYPLSKITQQIEKNNLDNAKQTLLEFGNAQFLKKLTRKWYNLEPFHHRQRVFVEALNNHENKQFLSSIHTLSPHIEGVITDFLNSQFNEIPKNTKDKIQLFLKHASSTEESAPFIFKSLLQSLREFFMTGPPIKSFKWLETIDYIFPNRNVVGHGKYDESLYNEENSLKLFLLIDTIYYVMTNMPENWIKQ